MNDSLLPTVVLMSGLPTAPGDRHPNWICTAWPPETGRILQAQWDLAVPHWQRLAAFAEEHGVLLAVEMHANQLVYNAPTLLRLREAVGPVVGANMDPSHLMWMGSDPIASVRALDGAITCTPRGLGATRTRKRCGRPADRCAAPWPG
jgi:sugar phosphate isomerase/epimerase